MNTANTAPCAKCNGTGTVAAPYGRLMRGMRLVPCDACAPADDTCAKPISALEALQNGQCDPFTLLSAVGEIALENHKQQMGAANAAPALAKRAARLADRLEGSMRTFRRDNDATQRAIELLREVAAQQPAAVSGAAPQFTAMLDALIAEHDAERGRQCDAMRWAGAGEPDAAQQKRIKREIFTAALRAALAAAQPAIPEGYALVPLEPTEEMRVAGFESEAMDALSSAAVRKGGWPYTCRQSADCVAGVYRAMLAAAPAGGTGGA
jgi:hypothetical protein